MPSRACALLLPFSLTFGACFNPDGSPLGTEGSSTSTEGAIDTAPASGSPTSANPTADPTVDPTVEPDSSASVSVGTDPTTMSGDTADVDMPEIELSVDGVSLASGDLYELAGEVELGALGPAVEITVRNVGTGTLQLGGVSPFGPHDADFTIGQGALAFELAADEASAFLVAFTPTSRGRRELVLRMGTNDPDENPYELTVAGYTVGNVYRDIMPPTSPSPRFNAAMVDLEDGRLLLFGGRDRDGASLNDTWLFDVEAEQWTPQPTDVTPIDRYAHGMASLGDGRVLMFGGNGQGGGGGGAALSDTWIFDPAADPATDPWREVNPPISPLPRFQHHMVSVPDGVLLYGGRVANNSELGDLWRFDAGAEAWSNIDVPPDPGLVASGAIAFDGDDTVVFYGGFTDQVPRAQTWHYRLSTSTWTLVPTLGTSPGARAVLEGTYFPNGQMIVYSGKQDFCCMNPVPGTFGYDPVTTTWTELTPAAEPSPRFNYSVAFVASRNKSIIFGGNESNGGPGGAVGDTWEYVGTRPP